MCRKTKLFSEQKKDIEGTVNSKVMEKVSRKKSFS